MTIAKKITFGFATPVVLLIVVGLLARSMSERQATTTSWVERSLDVKLNVQRLLTRILDAETGARAFYLIADDQFLELYRTAQVDTDRFIETLSKLTEDNTEQHARVQGLTSAVAARFQVLSENIERRRRAPFDDATGRAALLAGKQAMDALRAQFATISDAETTLLVKRRAEADDTARSAQVFLMIALALGVIVSLVSSLLIARSILRPLSRI
ncbi:MAG: CHASE3 domain-containing protein, partial [Deltaproteobacteria bacterium]|nr:CHASE3 domain-containing protein [Deltaproteobacteria bacterium]